MNNVGADGMSPMPLNIRTETEIDKQQLKTVLTEAFLDNAYNRAAHLKALTSIEVNKGLE